MKNCIRRLLLICAFGLSTNAGAASMILTIEDTPAPGYPVLVPEVSPGIDYYINLYGYQGIRVGEAQSASGTHLGAPDGSESPGIDLPWNYFGNTALHVTNSPVEVLSRSSNTMELDFSGWGFLWSFDTYQDYLIPLGDGPSNGIASVVCEVDCSFGDRYSLEYIATVPEGHISGFGNVVFNYHLQGYIQAVPLPASAGLFFFGLLGMSGFMAGGKRALFKKPVNDELSS